MGIISQFNIYSEKYWNFQGNFSWPWEIHPFEYHIENIASFFGTAANLSELRYETELSKMEIKIKPNVHMTL